MSSFKKTLLTSAVIGLIILIFSAVTFGEQVIDNLGAQIDDLLTPPSEVSENKVAQKYDSSVQIKAKYKLDGASLKTTPKDDWKDRIEVMIGNKDATEFSPDLKIARWDDEVNLVIKPKALESVATKDKDLKFDGDKIKFETPKIDYHLYELTEGKGGYEFEVILKEKPTSNIVSLDIETKNLDFFYQPITQRDFNEFSLEARELYLTNGRKLAPIGNFYESPDGSVWENGGFYMAYPHDSSFKGKIYPIEAAFAVLRPRITDGSGAWIWGELNIDNGKMTITVSQEFLDKAVYPIIVDPTISYIQGVKAPENDGSVTSSTATFASNTTNGNAIVVMVFWKNDVTITSVTDPQSNSYVDSGLGRLSRPVNGYLQVLGATNITGGTTPTITVNFSGNATEIDFYVTEYSGQNTSSLFGEGSTGTATSGTTVTTGEFTPSVTDGAIIAFSSSNAGGSGSNISFGGSFTTRLLHELYPYSQGFGDYIFTSSVGTISVTATFAQALTKAGIIAVTIKAAVVAETSCGDATCDSGETCANCPADCGACPAGAVILKPGTVFNRNVVFRAPNAPTPAAAGYTGDYSEFDFWVGWESGTGAQNTTPSGNEDSWIAINGNVTKSAASPVFKGTNKVICTTGGFSEPAALRRGDGNPDASTLYYKAAFRWTAEALANTNVSRFLLVYNAVHGSETMSAFLYDNAGTIEVGVRVNRDNDVITDIGARQVVTQNEWYEIELKYIAGGTSGWRLFKDGAQIYPVGTGFQDDTGTTSAHGTSQVLLGFYEAADYSYLNHTMEFDEVIHDGTAIGSTK